MSNHSQPATGKQLTYLRSLANQTGTTFITPGDRRQASREIERLSSLKRGRGRHDERAGRPGREPAYATAPQSSEIEGWGASAQWRTSKPPEPAPRRPGASPDTPEAGSQRVSGRHTAKLATYREDAAGTTREVVTVKLADAKLSDATLLIDRHAGTHDDARLVGRLEAEEPPENAEILTRLYLQDPNRGRCRPVAEEDLHAPPSDPTASGTPAVRWDAPLVAGIGVILRLQVLAADGGTAAAHWTMATETDGRSESEPVSLRKVIGRLQDYEPAMSMTAAAIRAYERSGHSTCTLRMELKRVAESPIVLNRRLRERVEHAVATEGLTMSEIAIRCGRIKRDKRGNESGETSWLARRIGQLPEAGKPRPTPWVHTDVLALIARDGLGVSPRDVEAA
jgi:hypothetical protein